MTKSFYAVIPYAPRFSAAETVGFLRRGGRKEEGAAANSFNEDRLQLEQRMTFVASGLASIGIRAAPLGTEEVIELLYRSFNPGELENPIRLSD